MRKFLLVFLLLPLLTMGQNRKKKDYLVSLNTRFGTMRLVLYDQTPKHKENFIKLVNQKFYDSLLFHRIIPLFMIQGGDPNSRKSQADEPLGMGAVDYKIPAEFAPGLFHKKGALAAARDNNPEKASSGCQFYIVQGRVWNDEDFQKQIARIQTMKGRLPTDEQKKVYQTLGGSPHLDGNYTVFGEVIDGLAVVDSIVKQPRNEMDRPNQDVRMSMTGSWIKKKKIKKQYGYQYL
ncbi:peptidylprolyl isomerase [Spirosoma endbachense]|uniref:Peptidyl-prolyl cis-trans isomerase n=1 Tax=Spirosoma endbachense TaxID=2666025 RepID=A0A6P1VNI0_9BACT|nr:peptidylprolyl isomerase [Spirosoma endbachense]QHV94255.1 peptidylprolyl isomerase [Spirosoma endbachense]